MLNERSVCHSGPGHGSQEKPKRSNDNERPRGVVDHADTATSLGWRGVMPIARMGTPRMAGRSVTDGWWHRFPLWKQGRRA
jgi:hypothetical protein